jgi:hypothetical protein
MATITMTTTILTTTAPTAAITMAATMQATPPGPTPIQWSTRNPEGSITTQRVITSADDDGNTILLL